MGINLAASKSFVIRACNIIIRIILLISHNPRFRMVASFNWLIISAFLQTKPILYHVGDFFITPKSQYCANSSTCNGSLQQMKLRYEQSNLVADMPVACAESPQISQKSVLHVNSDYVRPMNYHSFGEFIEASAQLNTYNDVESMGMIHNIATSPSNPENVLPNLAVGQSSNHAHHDNSNYGLYSNTMSCNYADMVQLNARNDRSKRISPLLNMVPSLDPVNAAETLPGAEGYNEIYKVTKRVYGPNSDKAFRRETETYGHQVGKSHRPKRSSWEGSSTNSLYIGTLPSPHADPDLKEGFSQKTVQLLAELDHFRTGLQSNEAHRRRVNMVLQRDPAGGVGYSWHKSLPGGWDSPFPL